MTKPLLILVADDETHVVNVLAVKLQSAGYAVVCAHDGETALHIAIDQVPGLVIAASRMPVLNGHELCVRLLANKSTAKVPVIILTGHNQIINDNAARTANVRAVIGKPFSPRDVLNNVDELLKPTPGKGLAKAS